MLRPAGGAAYGKAAGDTVAGKDGEILARPIVEADGGGPLEDETQHPRVEPGQIDDLGIDGIVAAALRAARRRSSVGVERARSEGHPFVHRRWVRRS
jgi:hypothetical protein